MALGRSRPHCFPRQNLPSTDPVEDKLVRDPIPVEGPHSSSTSSIPSRHLTPGLTLVPALNPAPTPALTPTNKLFKKFLNAYLESNQGSRQPPEERKPILETKVPEVYYGKLHMDCYHFCQQCKDHFETAGAIGFNRTPFTV